MFDRNKTSAQSKYQVSQFLKFVKFISKFIKPPSKGAKRNLKVSNLKLTIKSTLYWETLALMLLSF